jgi:hypothetical protein
MLGAAPSGEVLLRSALGRRVSMTRERLLMALLISIGACAEGGSTDTTPTERCTSALVADQGVNWQGIQFQGVSGQGISLQGVQAQGIVANGMVPHFIASNGISTQAIATNGLQPQAIATNGLQPQAIATNGVQAQAIATNGTFELGLKGEGFAPARSRLRGAVLEVITDSGRVLSGSQLVGMRLPAATTDGKTVWLTIASFEPVEDDPELARYGLEYQGQSLCENGATGLFVSGVWDATGARSERTTSAGLEIDATFSCPIGVIAKCVLWGYRPWAQDPALHQACTRMARADYCGDGVPHTRNGTLIDMFDGIGIQQRAGAEGFSFEAGWGPDGAVCVREPRYRDTDQEGRVHHPSCWSGKPRCDSWEQAAPLGALMGNDSAHAERSVTCSTN